MKKIQIIIISFFIITILGLVYNYQKPSCVVAQQCVPSGEFYLYEIHPLIACDGSCQSSSGSECSKDGSSACKHTQGLDMGSSCGVGRKACFLTTYYAQNIDSSIDTARCTVDNSVIPPTLKTRVSFDDPDAVAKCQAGCVCW